MSRKDDTLSTILLSYVSFIAARHSYGPGDGFEYKLWDDQLQAKLQLVSRAEKQELVSLVIRTEAWVSFNVESSMLQLIDLDAWRLVLEHRDH